MDMGIGADLTANGRCQRQRRLWRSSLCQRQQLRLEAGAGLEYKFWSNPITLVEYLHYGFAKTAYSFPVLIAPQASTTIDTARGGLSYKF
jgi:hypothetical protein